MRCGGEGLSAWQVLVKVMFDFIMAIQHQHARCNTQDATCKMQQDATRKMQHPRCNTQARHMQIPAGVRFIMAMHNSDDSLGGVASSCRGTRTPWPFEPMAYSEYPFSISNPCAARAATSARAVGRLAQFNTPVDIAILGNTLYVVSEVGQIVQAVDLTSARGRRRDERGEWGMRVIIIIDNNRNTEHQQRPHTFMTPTFGTPFCHRPMNS